MLLVVNCVGTALHFWFLKYAHTHTHMTHTRLSHLISHVTCLKSKHCIVLHHVPSPGLLYWLVNNVSESEIVCKFSPP